MLTVGAADGGKRLDHYLKDRFAAVSRALIQEWIKAGRVHLNGTPAKASATLRGGESISVDPAERPPLKAEAEDIPVEILYQDDSVIAVNKPAGMVVHAGAGVHSGTLVNALLHRFGQLSLEGGDLRPGIVHRLDKDTSGVILVARNDAAHRRLAAQFSERTVEKVYLALVHKEVKRDNGVITKPIARDPVHRTRMTARLATGRHAISEYRVLRRYPRHTLLEVRIGTGRTHQIRVHLASIGHPVAGDTLYGAPAQQPPTGRFFLHAQRITFVSPATGKTITVEAPLPPELQAWLAHALTE
ncbi:MAG: RluA family pseudouridine synthase [Acidobacteria bacterium]|nr:RluA family pseudouridine synthase [Acidobacteriota bacterium]